MFQHDGMMCCSTCFEEMIQILHDSEGKPIGHICPNCGKLTEINDEL